MTTVIIPSDPSPGANTVTGRATAINEAGVVAGSRTGPEGTNVFLWKDGVMTLLPVAFLPVAVNRKQDIAGNAGTSAVVWRDGVLTELETPAGATSTVNDMNEKRVVAGSVRFTGTGVTRAVIWENGVLTDLGTLGGSSAVATSINRHGQVVGYSRIAGNTADHAFLWEDGVMTDLGTLGGTTSRATGINSAGEIVGVSNLTPTTGCSLVPFIYRRGAMSQLPTPGRSCLAMWEVTGISDAGHVIGEYVFSSNRRAWVWRDGVVVDLIAGGPDTFVLDVNSAGEIVGYTSPSVATWGAYQWLVGRKGP